MTPQLQLTFVTLPTNLQIFKGGLLAKAMESKDFFLNGEKCLLFKGIYGKKIVPCASGSDQTILNHKVIVY